MSRALIVIHGDADRERAARWAAHMPDGTRVEFKASKRSLPQNDHMWGLLTEVAQQKEHCGRHYSAEQWKLLFVHACGQEISFIPSLDTSTFLPWGGHTSDMSKEEMSALIDFIYAWGEENGVKFRTPPKIGEPV